MKRTIGIAALAMAGFLVAAPAGWAADEYNVSSGMTAAGAPLGFHGVDPVAFVSLGSRIPGSAAYTAVHDGVAYYFDSAQNKSAFEADPSAYLPQYGGFCAYGVSVGKKFDGDPRFAAVRDGKLYVFLNQDVFEIYLANEAETVAGADENWPRIETIAADAL